MKHVLNGIIVVEGTGDSSYLSSFIDCDFVTTNGYDLPKEELEYLQEASKKVQIYIMTDPDEAGENIRKRIHEVIDGVDIVVDATKCNKNGKHGVAECDKTEVINTLEKFFVLTKNNKEYVSKKYFKVNDFDREEIYLFTKKKFKLGKCNRKQIIKRLNVLQITEEELGRAIKEQFTDGN